MKFLACDMKNRRRIVFYIFGIQVLLCAGGAHNSFASIDRFQQSDPNICKSTGSLFDCAASSLYGLCNKSGISMSYEECIKLLPRSSKGNNMLELKQVLQRSGFKVRAEELSAEQSGDVNLPCIVLLIPSGINAMGRKPGTIGHYMVLWPVDAEKVEILDYPRPPFTVNRNYWGKHLQTVGITTVSVLVCDRPK